MREDKADSLTDFESVEALIRDRVDACLEDGADADQLMVEIRAHFHAEWCKSSGAMVDLKAFALTVCDSCLINPLEAKLSHIPDKAHSKRAILLLAMATRLANLGRLESTGATTRLQQSMSEALRGWLRSFVSESHVDPLLKVTWATLEKSLVACPKKIESGRQFVIQTCLLATWESPYFDLLMGNFTREARGFLYKWGCQKADADDVIQNCFLKLHEVLRQYDPNKGANFRTWAWRVFRNVHNDWGRKHKRWGKLHVPELGTEKDDVKSGVRNKETPDKSKAGQPANLKIEAMELNIAEAELFDNILMNLVAMSMPAAARLAFIFCRFLEWPPAALRADAIFSRPLSDVATYLHQQLMEKWPWLNEQSMECHLRRIVAHDRESTLKTWEIEAKSRGISDANYHIGELLLRVSKASPREPLGEVFHERMAMQCSVTQVEEITDARS